MKHIKIMMGMTLRVEVVDPHVKESIFKEVFDYFTYIDEKFSTYKTSSEISQINRAELTPEEYSPDMKAIFSLSEKTKKNTNGFFDIQRADGTYDPSGLVKGWAIYNAAEIIKNAGYVNYYVDAGGDVQVHGNNEHSEPWSIGIKNPFNVREIVKVVYVHDQGVATSGTYERGNHIYNPHNRNTRIDDVVSLTVVGPNIYEADRFATAAFAMGAEGITFIEQLPGLEAYMINKEGIATMTSGFEQLTHA